MITEAQKAYRKQWQKDNPEKTTGYARKWRLAHSEYLKEYYLAHKEKAKESAKKSKLTHPSKNDIYCKNWRLRHPMKAKARGKAQVAKRRDFGFTELNKCFCGSDAHHIDKQHVVYIPSELHKSVWHSILANKNMLEINNMSLGWLANQISQ